MYLVKYIERYSVIHVEMVNYCCSLLCDIWHDKIKYIMICLRVFETRITTCFHQTVGILLLQEWMSIHFRIVNQCFVLFISTIYFWVHTKRAFHKILYRDIERCLSSKITFYLNVFILVHSVLTLWNCSIEWSSLICPLWVYYLYYGRFFTYLNLVVGHSLSFFGFGLYFLASYLLLIGV